jgi:hypothetical protein
MIVQAQVGPIGTASAGDGQMLNARQGKLADLIVSEFQGRLYEATYRGQVFTAANQAGTATTVGLATTYTGISLSNPVGNTKNLSILGAGWAFPVAPAACVVVGLMVGYNGATNVTHSTPITPKCNLVGPGAGAPTGLADAASALPTAPWIERILGKVDSGAVSVDTQGAVGNVQIEGGIVLQPGAYIAIYTSTVANTAGFFGSFQWAEMPI